MNNIQVIEEQTLEEDWKEPGRGSLHFNKQKKIYVYNVEYLTQVKVSILYNKFFAKMDVETFHEIINDHFELL